MTNNEFSPDRNCLTMVAPSDDAAAIYKHLRVSDPDVLNAEYYKWACGPVSIEMPYLSVVEAEASKNGKYWHYLSAGASKVQCGGTYGLEFCLSIARRNPLHVELISMVAYMHRSRAHHLGVGHTMKIGRPLVQGSGLDRLLVSLPYPYGVDFEYAHLPDGSHARILWLLPITESEETFCHSVGLEALEERFEEKQVDYLDAFRSSVI